MRSGRGGSGGQRWRALGGVFVAVAASLLVHAAGLRLLRLVHAEAARAVVAAVDIEFGPLVQPSAPAPEAWREPEAAPRPLRPTPARAAKRQAAPRPARGAAERGEAVAPMHATEAETTAAADSVSKPAQPAPSLSPRGAALSMFAAQATGAGVADTLAQRRGDELSAELRAVANAVAPAKRRPIALRRDADGTCHFDGHSIAATIFPDGRVAFQDKAIHTAFPAPQQPPERPTTPEELNAPQRLDFMVKVTGRAWQAEREWFLRETQDLRAELAAEVHTRALRVAEVRLRDRLERLWCDTSIPVLARRRELFTVWDDTSADPVGEQGRRVVIDFIRDEVPATSAQAYSKQELAELNLARQQPSRFEPYELADAVAPVRD